MSQSDRLIDSALTGKGAKKREENWQTSGFFLALLTSDKALRAWWAFRDRVSLCNSPTVLELALVDLAGLELTEFKVSNCILSSGIKGIRHHHPACPVFFFNWEEPEK